MVYGYCRVSTNYQLKGTSIEDQKEKILERYPDAIIVIEAYSGAKQRDKFNTMIQDAKKEDTIISTKLDRFCRNTKEGLEVLDLLIKKEVRIHILNMGLIENTPIGRMLLTQLMAFSEFERAMIIERTLEGKQRAKQKKGFREGRVKKFKKQQIEHALELLSTHSYSQVAEMSGMSKSTLVRANKEKKRKENKWRINYGK